MPTIYREVQQWKAFMPSGIKPGDDLTQPMRDALEHRAGLPPMYQPIIEEGTYDDFKECVFRACSLRACEVALEDMEQECVTKGMHVQKSVRHWLYGADPKCVTRVDVRLDVREMDPSDLKEFLAYLAGKYGFTYNRIVVDRAHTSVEGRGGSMYYIEPRLEVEMELMWPYWT